MQLYFRARQRTATLHLLSHTSLRPEIERVGYITDGDGLLSIDVPRDGRAQLSNGERALIKFLASLAGQDAINLWSLFEAIDRDCQLAVLDALGIALGLVVAEAAA